VEESIAVAVPHAAPAKRLPEIERDAPPSVECDQAATA
jgi:hypothetical protein